LITHYPPEIRDLNHPALWSQWLNFELGVDGVAVYCSGVGNLNSSGSLGLADVF
jgi:hypothetical protein